MKTSPRLAGIIPFTCILFLIALALTTPCVTAGVPQPKLYAALLAKARAGTLRVVPGEAPAPRPLAMAAGKRAGSGSEIFPPTSYRAAAKTSFESGPVETFATLDALFTPLPADSKMSKDFPKLVVKKGNVSPRVPLEKRNVKIPAFIYWVAPESDHDFHVILGSTSELTSTTRFMNSEISGLPSANPTKSPFPQRRSDIRAMLKKHENVDGLFVKPVPVSVTGTLLWDGEHRAPHNVGPEGLRPTKAWEIHPIKLLAER
ncbi:MAG: hypothetical protein QOH88_439 [Verrucomicrobiota bacterium]|jgi:hypothetical protein